MPQESRELDRSFRHYSLKHRTVAWLSTTLFSQFAYTVRHGLVQGMKRKGGLGWLPLPASHVAATPEERFWRSLGLKGLIVYDIGAFEGTLTLFCASRCGWVVSYEPNTRNHHRLIENIRLNRLNNVTARKVGVGARRGSGELVYMPLMAGGGSLETNIADQLRKSGAPIHQEQIPITTLDEDIHEAALPAPDLIKIDVEGFELEALQGAANTIALHRPALFLEMHGETIREKQRKTTEIVDWLTRAGYTNILHVETNTRISAANAAIAMEGHLYSARPV